MTEGGPERAPLSVTTDLSLSVDGTEAALRSTGERLFLEFPSLVSAVRALRGLPATEYARLHTLLTSAGLALEVRVRHRTILAIGADARSGPLARYLDIEPAQLRLSGVLSAVWAWALVTAEWFRE